MTFDAVHGLFYANQCESADVFQYIFLILEHVAMGYSAEYCSKLLCFMMLAIIGLCQAFADDVFDGVLFCAVLFSYEMSWMRSGIEMSQFLRIFLPTFTFLNLFDLLERLVM